MKKCGMCQEEKQVEEFDLAGKKGRHSYCKPCHRQYTQEHYQNNKDKYRRNHRKNQHTHRQKMREMTETLRSVPCKDCGAQYHPFAMDFDHVRGKKIKDVGKLVGQGYAKKTILTEIDKCDIVCAICHRLRTLERLENSKVV